MLVKPDSNIQQSDTEASPTQNAKEPNANEMAMLFANMGKLDELSRIITLKRDIPLGLSTSKIAIDQMMDCFVKGAAGSYNSKADFDYLVYLFADLAKVKLLFCPAFLYLRWKRPS